MKPTLLLPFAFLALACNSPLLNHSDASDGRRARLEENDPLCPIRFAKVDFCASWTWERTPSDQEMGAATLRFWKRSEGTEAGPYLHPGREVFVKLWMPSMGHGSSPVLTTPRLDPTGSRVDGVYDSKNIFFVMPGDWEIWIQLRDTNGFFDQAKLDLSI